ncbi:ATP-binding protein [Pseudogemmobacter bohemicus]|uniref:ATP-binding protein n=1 Tax=Pseudogemmobacter bohemicus TaxID=2250708 RepID=UPI000DD35CC2|nr:ATP-binding protein [Pseudogemmobacter bohemicus]
MSSIRMRLFLILMAATGVVWLSAVIWIQYSTRMEVNHVLDRRLQESAHMVASLIARNGGVVGEAVEKLAHPRPHILPEGGPEGYSHELICQVWGFDGRLKSESDGAPRARLADDAAGFSEREVEGETWRVYSHIDTELGVRVMVGDALSMRERLVRGVILGLLAPALAILPVLAALIWFAVGRGLAPLDRLARGLAARPATDLSALDLPPGPRELRPMVSALNGLFRRVNSARERERSFTAFAAHELKTPLAGLKTQAQIATIAPDEATRNRALAQISTGVARTDRMVRQLLDMTAAENAAETSGESGPEQDGARLLADLAEGLHGLAAQRGVGLETRAATGLWRTRQAMLLAPALRNLIENAILASPPGAVVEASMACDTQEVRFTVLDRGPGILASDRAHVTERFWRGASSPSGQGSGLGLAIVAAVMERMGGRLSLSPRDGGGERAELILPAA